MSTPITSPLHDHRPGPITSPGTFKITRNTTLSPYKKSASTNVSPTTASPQNPRLGEDDIIADEAITNVLALVLGYQLKLQAIEV